MFVALATMFVGPHAKKRKSKMRSSPQGISLSLRISRVHIMLKRELNESCEKGTVTGIILSKRKGGIYNILPTTSLLDREDSWRFE